MRNNETRVAPIFRWAGSKRKLLPRLVPFWGGGYLRYCEPFAGSAALFFALRPRKAILSDTNSELIEALKVIRADARAVYNKVSRFPTTKKTYYSLRSQDTRYLRPLDRAARFVFLNRFCFNGLYRTDAQGRFNVPYSPEGTGNLPSKQQFLFAASVLKSAKLICNDFEYVVLKNVSSGDFVYLDPPYAVENRRIFRQYGPNTFGLDDMKRLAKALIEIDRRGAFFVLSYAYCAEAKKFFAGWYQRRIYTTRNISGFAKHRRKAAELLISNIKD